MALACGFGCTSATGGIWTGLGAASVSIDAGPPVEASHPVDTGVPDTGISCQSGGNVGPTVGTWSYVNLLSVSDIQPPAVAMTAGPGDFYFALGEPFLAIDHLSIASGTIVPVDVTGLSSRAKVAVGIVNGMLYAYGGATDCGSTQAATTGAVLDLATQVWTPLPTTNAPNLDDQTEAVTALAWGGAVGFVETEFGLYDPTTQTWSSPSYPSHADCSNSVVVGTNRAFCSSFADIESYLISTGSSASTPPVVQVIPAIQGDWGSETLQGAFLGSTLYTLRSGSGGDALYELTPSGWRQVGANLPGSIFGALVAVNGELVIWQSFFQPAGLTVTVYDPTTDSFERASCTGAPDLNTESVTPPFSDGQKLYWPDDIGGIYVLSL
jgi:hypothetical protein